MPLRALANELVNRPRMRMRLGGFRSYSAWHKVLLLARGTRKLTLRSEKHYKDDKRGERIASGKS